MEVNIEKDESIDDLQLNGLQLIQKNESFAHQEYYLEAR